MKIDFKQLAKIEKQYYANNNNIAINTLQQMIDRVLNKDGNGINNDIAIESLKELGILKDDSTKEIQQLNS